jgi:hypothetical protein
VLDASANDRVNMGWIDLRTGTGRPELEICRRDPRPRQVSGYVVADGVRRTITLDEPGDCTGPIPVERDIEIAVEGTRVWGDRLLDHEDDLHYQLVGLRPVLQ